MGLVFQWKQKHGGVAKMEENSKKKSSMVYDVIDHSSGFYSCPVDKSCRSRMNITFRVGSPEGCDILEEKFLSEAAKLGMIQLKGHRSVGGIRASLYNAVSIQDTQTLVDFMKRFYEEHRN